MVNTSSAIQVSHSLSAAHSAETSHAPMVPASLRSNAAGNGLPLDEVTRTALCHGLAVGYGYGGAGASAPVGGPRFGAHRPPRRHPMPHPSTCPDFRGKLMGSEASIRDALRGAAGVAVGA